jgi:hypothetical protein
MKGSAKYIFGIIVCLLLTVGLVLPVQAKAGSNEVVVSSDPIVIGLSGDMSFTANVIKQTALPGTVVKDEKVLPVGYEDELQFIGNGVEVKDVTNGTENACFNFNLYNYGWTGNVYQWNGSKWSKLTTTVKDGSEGGATACAVIHGNGNYALLAGLTHPMASSFGPGNMNVPPKTPECGEVLSITPFVYTSVTGTQVLFTAQLSWAANVTRVGIDISNSDLHFTALSSGTLLSLGEEYPTHYYPTGEKDESLNINNAIIYTGTTVDVHLTYKVDGDDTKHSCIISGVEVGENPK